MRKEMDELRSAIREKTERSVDRLVKATDSPFTTARSEERHVGKECVP